MRTIVHVSDLHFGRSSKTIEEALFASIRHIEPHLVIISGDLTQRARKDEFSEAQKFLERLDNNGFKYFVIPGNHDIPPFYRPVGRLLNPFKHYREYISAHTESFFVDEEIAITSINTVRALTIENGAVTNKQLLNVAERFANIPDSVVKFIVTHHPLQKNPTKRMRRPAWRAKNAVANLSFVGVDVYLSGHLHRTAFAKRTSLTIHAGTVSERLRGEPQSFNVITLDVPYLSVTRNVFDEKSGQFVSGTKTTHLIRGKFRKPKETKGKRIGVKSVTQS